MRRRPHQLRSPSASSPARPPAAAGRGGFTLVEALLATALTALLMLAVLAVVGSAARASRATEHPQPWIADAVELLRRDLLCAHSLRQEGASLVLEGHGALDVQGLLPTHRPARISYALVGTGRQRHLLRLQQPLDELSTGAQWGEVLCGDVASFRVTAVGAANKGAEASKPAGEVPAQVRIVLQLNGAQVPAVDQIVVVR